MSSNNDYDYTEREKKVLELYDSGKSTRDIAKILRMSLRDISFILKKSEVNHGLVIIDNGNNNNKIQKEYKASTAFFHCDCWKEYRKDGLLHPMPEVDK